MIKVQVKTHAVVLKLERENNAGIVLSKGERSDIVDTVDVTGEHNKEREKERKRRKWWREERCRERFQTSCSQL